MKHFYCSVKKRNFKSLIYTLFQTAWEFMKIKRGHIVNI